MARGLYNVLKPRNSSSRYTTTQPATGGGDGGGDSQLDAPPALAVTPLYLQCSAPGAVCQDCVPTGEGDLIVTVIPLLLHVLLFVVVLLLPFLGGVMGLRLTAPPPDSLPSKANGPKGAKPGVAVPYPHSLFKHLLFGEGLAGHSQGDEESVAKGAGAGHPIGKPWICCLSTQHGAIAVATWMCCSLPSSLIQEWGHCVGLGAAPYHGVTPFPPALLQPELRMELLNSQQTKGFRPGGVLETGVNPGSSPSVVPFSLDCLQGISVPTHLCVMLVQWGISPQSWLPHPYIPKPGRSPVA